MIVRQGSTAGAIIVFVHTQDQYFDYPINLHFYLTSKWLAVEYYKLFLHSKKAKGM